MNSLFICSLTAKLNNRKENKKMKSKTRTLVESAILLAIATMLSFFPKFEGIWANGGSVTVCSMLPIIIVSYRHGIKWGLLTGFAFSVLQLVTGGFVTIGVAINTVILSLLLDYILPYTVIGLGGIFKNRIKNPSLAMAAGTIFVLILRYISHLISGVVLWKSIEYAQEYFSADGFGIGSWAIGNFSGDALFNVYNLVYNGSYMLPELLITTAGALIVGRIVAAMDKK